MTCAIVSAPHAQSAFVTHKLATHILDVVTGGGRVYVFSFVNRRDADLRFIDPFDGVLLVECKFFDDEPAARQWVAADIALRGAQMGGVQ
jgi:hypothetical protein